MEKIWYDATGLAILRGLVLVRGSFSRGYFWTEITNYSSASLLPDSAQLPANLVKPNTKLPALYTDALAYMAKEFKDIPVEKNVPFSSKSNILKAILIEKIVSNNCTIYLYSSPKDPISAETRRAVVRAVEVGFPRWGLSLKTLDVVAGTLKGAKELGSTSATSISGRKTFGVFLNLAYSATPASAFSTMVHEICHVVRQKIAIENKEFVYDWHDAKFCALLSMADPSARSRRKCIAGNSKDSLDIDHAYAVTATDPVWEPKAGYLFLMPSLRIGRPSWWMWVPRREGLWKPVEGLWNAEGKASLVKAFGRQALKDVKIERLPEDPYPSGLPEGDEPKESLADALAK